MSKKLPRTDREVAAWLLGRVADAHRAWKRGDACLAYRGDAQTKVVRVEGDIVHLANGEAMHRSKMRSIPEGR